MIPDSFKQELLHRVDIVEVVERHVQLKKGGANYMACCPFHSEKTPSFTVSPAKQFYHCFGCGAHGNAISFLMEYGGLGYIDAVKDLAQSAGMKMPEFEPRGAKEAGPDLYGFMERASEYYRAQLKASPRAIDYLKGRGLTGQVAARFGIGYAPPGWQNLQAVFPEYGDKALKDAGLVIDAEGGRRYDRFRDRIMFPILNQRGSVIGFGGRVLGQEPSGDESKEASGPKYLNSPETPLFEKGRELYGLPQARGAIRASGRVIVVEGYMDVVALAQHGIECAVATLGTATSTAHVQKLLRQTDEVVFCFDGDAAGVKAAWHALEVSLPSLADHKAVRFLFLPSEHDPDSFVRERGKEAFEAALAEATPLSAFLLDELKRRVDAATPEGRSRLVHEAKPLLQKVAAPAMQLQLLKALAEAARMTQEETAQLCGIRVTRGFGGHSAGRAALAREERAPMQSLEIWLLKRLIVAPGLARDVPLDRLRGDSFESRALQAFIEFGREAPGANFDALLIDRFQGTEFDGLFKQMQKEAMVLNLTPEQVTEEFRDALPNLERLHVRERLGDLERQAAERELDAEERARLSALTQRLWELDRSRTGSPPVI